LKSPRNDTGMDMTNLHRSPPMNQSETDLGIVDESQLLRFGISLWAAEHFRSPGRTGLKAKKWAAICLAIAAQQAQPLLRGALDRTSVVNGYIINSKGVHVGVVMDDAVFGLKGQKLYDL
jgi:hypothetical protein